MSEHQNGPPEEVEGRTPHRDRPSTNSISSHHSADTAQSSGAGRQVDAYEDAVMHLLDCDLMPAADVEGLRAMWKHGGDSRRAAMFVAEAWGLAR
jgi:hypothetical protein